MILHHPENYHFLWGTIFGNGGLNYVYSLHGYCNQCRHILTLDHTVVWSMPFGLGTNACLGITSSSLGPTSYLGMTPSGLGPNSGMIHSCLGIAGIMASFGEMWIQICSLSIYYDQVCEVNQQMSIGMICGFVELLHEIGTNCRICRIHLSCQHLDRHVVSRILEHYQVLCISSLCGISSKI